MDALTSAEAREWCAAHQIPLDNRSLLKPRLDKGECRNIKIPPDAGHRIALLNELFLSVPADQDTLLWFTNWGIWPSGERMHMFEHFRISYNEYRGLAEVPAFIFSPNQREDLISFVGFAILFLWDCHLITATGDTWLFLSHDEHGWLCKRKQITDHV